MSIKYNTPLYDITIQTEKEINFIIYIYISRVMHMITHFKNYITSLDSIMSMDSSILKTFFFVFVNQRLSLIKLYHDSIQNNCKKKKEKKLYRKLFQRLCNAYKRYKSLFHLYLLLYSFFLLLFFTRLYIRQCTLWVN